MKMFIYYSDYSFRGATIWVNPGSFPEYGSKGIPGVLSVFDKKYRL